MGGNQYYVSEKPKNRKKWTRLELILTLMVISLAIYVFYLRSYSQNVEELPNYCEDISCYKTVTELYEFIDSSVDPCEDFHQFSCGNFLETVHKKEITSQIEQEQTRLENELNAMIVGPILSKNSRPIQIQKMFFQSCLKLEDIEANKNEKFLFLIKDIGGWPLLEGKKWNESNFDWKKIVIKCRKLGLPFEWFLEFGIYEEDRDYLKITYPIHINRTHNVDKIIVNLVGKKANIKDVIDFERRLLNISRPETPEIIIRTISELQKIHPPLDWLNFLNNITEESYEFTEETEIASNIDDYILRLHMLLTSTPKSTQANYIVWKILEYFAPYIQSGVDKNLDRFEFCKEATKEMFPELSSIEYIRKYPTSKIRNSVKEIAILVKEEFIHRTEDATWWNETEKQMYLDWFKNSGLVIGSRIENFDDDFLDDQYLHLKDMIFEKNSDIIEVLTAKSRSYFNSIFSKINKTSFIPEETFADLMKVDVFFDQNKNKMILPPPALHGFHLDHSGPHFINFASFGVSLAKVYVNTLRILTQNKGNSTDVAFQTSDKCLEADYLNLGEKNDFPPELISDILGRDISYKAYQKWIATHVDESQLPLLPYTPNQLFWIKSSLINCQLIDSTLNHISIRHSRHFGKDFSCDNSPMNPQEKC
ncbi:neprilysin-2-like [Tribolium madens]|uniref:neprilysin-2-like n=1 Tax=Tribolium madens TaxID=41895 RepID=UPI001CF72468|nr:neprilysin-2-like [Tribolium madens]